MTDRGKKGEGSPVRSAPAAPAAVEEIEGSGPAVDWHDPEYLAQRRAEDDDAAAAAGDDAPPAVDWHDPAYIAYRKAHDGGAEE